MIFKIAFRNIFRQKRRTILTMLTMFGGFTLASVGIAWMDGTYSNIIDIFTRNRLGHIQVHESGYLDRPSIYKVIEDYETIGEKTQAVRGVTTWAPRLYAAALASAGDKSAGVRIIGVDYRREVSTTHFDKKITEGAFFSSSASREAILGSGLATILNATIGDEIVIVSQAADGSIANDIYRVIGIATSGDAFSDQTAFYLTLPQAQELLALENYAHELIIIVDNLDRVRKLAARIAHELDDPILSVSPWQVFAKSFYEAMKADKKGGWITIAVIILVVAVGVLNTVLMSVLERRREYGTLKALGTRPTQIFRLILFEVNIMAAASIFFGALVALLANYALSIHGIPIPEPLHYGGMEFTEMYSEMNLRSMIIPAVVVLVSASFVAVFPAIRASRTDPARSMRMH